MGLWCFGGTYTKAAPCAAPRCSGTSSVWEISVWKTCWTAGWNFDRLMLLTCLHVFFFFANYNLWRACELMFVCAVWCDGDASWWTTVASHSLRRLTTDDCGDVPAGYVHRPVTHWIIYNTHLVMDSVEWSLNQSATFEYYQVNHVCNHVVR